MIRAYKEKDIDSIINIWHQASALAHSFLTPDFVEKTKKELRELYLPNSQTWVCEEKDNTIGFIAMLGNEIGGLFVLPDHHSKGIGTQLVNYVGMLYKTLEVEVFKNNNIGRAFYDNYGFKVIKEHFHEETQQKLLRMKFSK